MSAGFFYVLRLCCAGAILAAGSAQGQPVQIGKEGALAEIVPPIAGRKACFAREYDRKHLSEHPRQRVQRIVFQLEYHRHPPEKDTPHGQRNYYFSMAAKVRGESKTLHASGECVPSETGASCGVECDGGGLGLRREPQTGAILVDLTQHGRIRMTRGCGDEENAAEIEPGRDDKLFRLENVEPVACQSLKRP